MKSLILALFAITSLNAHASIEGPSCEDLTKTQIGLIKSAAKSFITKNETDTLRITSINATDLDCHDYDGVHSSSEIEVTWVQVDDDQKMECSQNLGVSVGYKNKVKTIDRNSKFIVEENSEVKCVN